MFSGFLRMLTKLEADIRVLDENFDALSERELERAINTASAFLSTLWDKAERDNIDLYRVRPVLSDVEYKIRSLEVRCKSKGFGSSTIMRFISRAFNFIAFVANLIGVTVGIGPLLPQIGSPKVEIKLLDYHPDYCNGDS